MGEDRRTVTTKKFAEELSAFQKTLSSTLDEKLSVLDKTLLSLGERLEGAIEKLSQKVISLESSITENKALVDKQSVEINVLKDENITLVSRIDELEVKLQNLENSQNEHKCIDPETGNKIKELENLVEERTNRQMRQTLVFKGIPEKKQESWKDTKYIVASTIAEYTDISKEDACDMLNRVHRSRPTQNPRKRNRRDIFAAMHSWEDCESLIKVFRNVNSERNSDSNDTGERVYIDYKYGPLTTLRRGEALKLRKELIDLKTIVSGYVSYPAKLMVKRTHGKDVPYVCEYDFSNVDVSDKIRELRLKRSQRQNLGSDKDS